MSKHTYSTDVVTITGVTEDDETPLGASVRIVRDWLDDHPGTLFKRVQLQTYAPIAVRLFLPHKIEDDEDE